MEKARLFLAIANREGFSPQAAYATYRIIKATLECAGHKANATFYIYRVTKKHGKRQGKQLDDEPSRFLLAFFSPDDALAFAQRQHVKLSPRLVPMNLAQLLAALVKHATIKSLIFTEEHAPVEPTTNIPTVFQLDRTELLAMLGEK